MPSRSTNGVGIDNGSAGGGGGGIAFDAGTNNGDILKKTGSGTVGKVTAIPAALIVASYAVTGFSNNIGIVEKGTTVSSITFTWTYNRNASNPASQGISPDVSSFATSLRTVTQTGLSLTADTVFTLAGVGDDSTNFSATTEPRWVYPYYYGVGAQGLTGAEIAGLTKLIVLSGNKTESFSPTAQVPYFAYPAAYGDLTSILDPNGFETIGDWTKSTKTIVGLDSTSQNYTCYEFNNPTTQSGFAYTFKY